MHSCDRIIKNINITINIVFKIHVDICLKLINCYPFFFLAGKPDPCEVSFNLMKCAIKSNKRLVSKTYEYNLYCSQLTCTLIIHCYGL